MAVPRASVRQRAMAAAALLAHDRALGPLDLIAERLAGPARAVALDLLGSPPEARRQLLAGELGTLGRSPEEGIRAALPGGLRPLAGEGSSRLLVGLTVKLLQRAGAGEGTAARLVKLSGTHATEDVSPRLAPALAWVAFCLVDDEAAAEALSARWPESLGRAMMDLHAGLSLDVPPRAAAEERGRLELEIASLG